MRTILGISGLIVLIFAQCSAPKEKIPPPPSLRSGGNKIVIYQMMPRLFGNVKTVNKPFGSLEENGVGKLEGISNLAIDGIKNLGVTHLLLVGIIEHATTTDYTTYGIPADDADVVRGRAGYPDAVRDFYDIDPDLAVDMKNRSLEFDRLVERIHKSDLKVILSLNPNQTARSYHSDAKPPGIEDFGFADDKTKTFAPNNNFYYLPGQVFQFPKVGNGTVTNTSLSKDGKFEESPAKVSANDGFATTPGQNDAFDAVKLNYGVDYLNQGRHYFDTIPDTWSKMRDVLVYWAEKNVDGFHCKEAGKIPVEFWHWVIPQVKAINPGIVFVAENVLSNEYRQFVNQGRFDFLIDKSSGYDTLRLLMNNKVIASNISRTQRSFNGINHNRVHFLENRDEVRLASSFFGGDSLSVFPGMVVSTTIDKGPVMIYFGQEVGEPALGVEGYGGNDGKTTQFDYWGVPEWQKWVNGNKYDGDLLSAWQKDLRKFYTVLLSFAVGSEAVVRGEYFDLTEFNVESKNFSNRVMVFVRSFEADNLIVVTSFNPSAEHIKVQLSSEVVAAMKLKSGTGNVMHDILGKAGKIEIAPVNFFEMELPAFGYAIFKVN